MKVNISFKTTFKKQMLYQTKPKPNQKKCKHDLQPPHRKMRSELSICGGRSPSRSIMIQQVFFCFFVYIAVFCLKTPSCKINMSCFWIVPHLPGRSFTSTLCGTFVWGGRTAFACSIFEVPGGVHCGYWPTPIFACLQMGMGSNITFQENYSFLMLFFTDSFCGCGFSCLSHTQMRKPPTNGF